jgi:hypothetical protein
MAVAEAGVDACHQLDVADAVLEADQVGAADTELFERGVVQDGVVAVVEDDAEAGRRADRLDMRGQTCAFAVDQVGRQQQQTVGSGGFGGAGELLRHGGSVAASGDDRNAAGGLLDRRGDDCRELGQGEREELARAAGGEESGGCVLKQPLDVVAIGRFIEGEVAGEVGDGEREQTRTDLRGKLLGRHLAHEVPGRAWRDPRKTTETSLA